MNKKERTAQIHLIGEKTIEILHPETFLPPSPIFLWHVPLECPGGKADKREWESYNFI